MLSREELLAKIQPSKRPEHLRKGQYIFNWIDANYQYPVYGDLFNEEAHSSIAREVQFIDKIDCFYDDSKIDEFLDACLRRINRLYNI